MIRNGSTGESKGKASNMNIYRVKKIQNKTQGLELKAHTNFKGQYSDLEGYVFNIGPRDLNKLSRTMRELERYLGATYSDI